MIINAIRWGAWSAGLCGGGIGKQWTEKENFQQYFYNRYKILHTCHTYCCYTYYFYAYWLYFIYVWHVYVSPKTYKWFGNFIIKDGRYTFTFFLRIKGVQEPARQPLDFCSMLFISQDTVIHITQYTTLDTVMTAKAFSTFLCHYHHLPQTQYSLNKWR
jgi:hypothetical protein